MLAEIETDKATMEVEAVDEGKLGRILVPAGTENVKVNTNRLRYCWKKAKMKQRMRAICSRVERAPSHPKARPKAEAFVGQFLYRLASDARLNPEAVQAMKKRRMAISSR